MKEIKKEITVFISEDGLEHSTEKECKKWEQHLIIRKLHKNLISCDFHVRCKIMPYFHNSKVEFLGSNYKLNDLDIDNSYLLVGGIMGNGDDRVRYKFHGSTIAMLKYSTDVKNQDLLCTIPSKWTELSADDLKIEVDKFINDRKLYKKVVNTVSTVSYVEI